MTTLALSIKQIQYQFIQTPIYLKISTEIEKRQISLESASIHLTGIHNDQGKFREWFDAADTSFNKLTAEYKDTTVHELASLQRFEKDAKTLEIILFSHQDDVQVMGQHLKAYTTTTEHFSKDLKNFCIKLKNNRIKRMSGEMASDLEALRQCVREDEAKVHSLDRRLAAFKAKLMQSISSHIKFGNACMRLELWLNEFEPKLKKVII